MGCDSFLWAGGEFGTGEMKRALLAFQRSNALFNCDRATGCLTGRQRELLSNTLD